jgi:hypothetical protein
MVTAITITMVTINIPRIETQILKRVGKHLLIYGRRKVGKTFMVGNCLDHDIYLFVKRGGGI